MLGRHKPDDLLAQIRCPVHLLAGQSDYGGALEARDVQRAIATLSHCIHTVFEGVGHMIHQERPEAYLQALIQLLGAA